MFNVDDTAAAADSAVAREWAACAHRLRAVPSCRLYLGVSSAKAVGARRPPAHAARRDGSALRRPIPAWHHETGSSVAQDSGEAN